MVDPNRGSILLTALLFLGIMALIASSVFESAVLQIKMVDNFKRNSECRIQAEQALIHLEAKIEHLGKCNLPECEFVQFIPDELYNMNVTGVSYYKLNHLMNSIYALRTKDYNDAVFRYDWLDLNGFSAYPIVGADPDCQGVRIYLSLSYLFDRRSVIQALQVKPYGSSKVIYTIDEATLFGTPILWHEDLIVEKPLENKIAVYDSHSGKKRQEALLKPDPTIHDWPFCLRSPVVLVKKAREQKRTVIISREGEIWSTELPLDYHRLGRRTGT